MLKWHEIDNIHLVRLLSISTTPKIVTKVEKSSVTFANVHIEKKMNTLDMLWKSTFHIFSLISHRFSRKSVYVLYPKNCGTIASLTIILLYVLSFSKHQSVDQIHFIQKQNENKQTQTFLLINHRLCYALCWLLFFLFSVDKLFFHILIHACLYSTNFLTE